MATESLSFIPCCVGKTYESVVIAILLGSVDICEVKLEIQIL